MNLEAISSALAGRLNDAVESLETVMLDFPQQTLPLTESLKNGLYVRELTIPAGTLLTGRVWLEDYVDIMLSGHIVVATADGVKELKGYNVCDGKGGRKRAGYAIEETKWITVHKVCADSCEGLLEAMSTMSMQEYRTKVAQIDYVNTFGKFEAKIKAISNSLDDFKSVPIEFADCIIVAESNIEGLGLFSQKYFKPGDHIVPALIEGKRTEAGKYSNHSPLANAEMRYFGKNVALIAKAEIKPGDEITTNYVHTLHSMKEALCLE